MNLAPHASSEPHRGEIAGRERQAGSSIRCFRVPDCQCDALPQRISAGFRVANPLRYWFTRGRLRILCLVNVGIVSVCGSANIPLVRTPQIVLALIFAVSGCDVPIDSFGTNQLVAQRLEMTESLSMEQPSQDAGQLLEEMFGTPDDPQWPESLDGCGVSLGRLQLAAGPVRSDEQGKHWGLYREHCIACHGVSGDGRGPSAALLNPYPRDFQLGKFKFKSTAGGKKPTRGDLRQILGHGIVGTGMPSFALLNDEESEALIDYVVYLSVRGEVERELLTFAAFNLDIDSGERLIAGKSSTAADRELLNRLGSKVVASWADAEAHAVGAQVGPPAGYPLFGSKDLSSSDQERLAQSIVNGEKLFQGNVAGCAFCHGMEARGDGQQNNYDDWTRDWTVLAGLNPQEKSELKPMLELGALKPRTILPRNLRQGHFRGGNQPGDLYTRIVCGIDGTPMPAAPMKPDNALGLTQAEVWDIVNFLLSLSPAWDAIAKQDAAGIKSAGAGQGGVGG